MYLFSQPPDWTSLSTYDTYLARPLKIIQPDSRIDLYTVQEHLLIKIRKPFNLNLKFKYFVRSVSTK